MTSQLNDRYNELRRWLKTGTVEVEFTTKNNDRRKMYCTINPALLGAKLDTQYNYVDNDNVFTVWDIDVDAWRSFKPDTVLTYKEILHEQDYLVEE